MDEKARITLIILLSSIIHVVAWYYGILMNELICGAMFIFGLYIGEDIHYEWWEFIIGWYNWIINIILIVLYRLGDEW